MNRVVIDLFYCGLLSIGVLSAVISGHRLQEGGRRSLAGRLLGRFGRQPPRMTIPPGVAAAVIPAHNEAAVLAATLRSVLAAFCREDVFVFCDNCTDATETIARGLLPAGNVVLGTRPRGKSRGVDLMLRRFILPRGYLYVTHIDADTTIAPDFLVQSLRVLRPRGVACVVGQIRSRWYPRSVFAVYRTVLYLFCVSIYRELQNRTGSLLIASGCATTWKTRVLRQLEFDHRLSIEDISLTFQVHRRRLGRVRYARAAVVWTQDPHDFASYRGQTRRWSRGWWEALRKHRMGLRPLQRNGRGLRLSLPDVVAALMVLDIVLLLAVDTLALLALLGRPLAPRLWWLDLATPRQALLLIGAQYAWMIAAALLVSLAIGRWRPLLYSPLFIPILYVDLLIFLITLVSTARSQYRRTPPATGPGAASVWNSPQRRNEV
jgi:poly-beta-1,6-N-acetyl-D-glucosamine synthase